MVSSDSELTVYQLIDGKLVPKPGNQRDPNKRYALVHNGREEYIREFTEEEQRQHDEDVKKWEEDRQNIVADELRQKKEFEEFKNSLKYELRFVVFLDILGWSNAIKKSTEDSNTVQKLGLALNIIHAQLKQVEWVNNIFKDVTCPGNPQFAYFSDSIIASSEPSLQGRDWLIRTINWLANGLLDNGFLLRGAFTFGYMYHNNTMAYGPALLRAINLEKDHACFPRVILDPLLWEKWGQGDRVVDKDGKEIGRFNTWRRNDDFPFLDFLQPPLSFPGHKHSQEILKCHFESTRNHIVALLSTNQIHETVMPKYRWLVNYFNSVLSEHEGCGVQAIIVDEP